MASHENGHMPNPFCTNIALHPIVRQARTNGDHQLPIFALDKGSSEMFSSCNRSEIDLAMETIR